MMCYELKLLGLTARIAFTLGIVLHMFYIGY